jgi:hypothetical protein
MHIALEIVTLLLVTLTMALALAHALEYPGKMRLTQQEYLAVQRIYYPGFTYAGAAEPLGVFALIVLFIYTPAGSPNFWLELGAIVAAIITHALYWALTAPANKVWLSDEKLSSSAQAFFRPRADRSSARDWRTWRAQWEASHLYRTLTATAAFILLVIALLLPS